MKKKFEKSEKSEKSETPATNLVEGLLFDYTSDDFKAHLLGRVKWHTDRAAWFNQQAEKAEAVDTSLDESEPDLVIATTQLAYDSPHSNRAGLAYRRQQQHTADQLRTQAKQHKLNSQKFQAYADHVILGKTYRLTAEDLGQIEVAPNFYG
jgi:hypothetical protein